MAEEFNQESFAGPKQIDDEMNNSVGEIAESPQPKGILNGDNEADPFDGFDKKVKKNSDSK